MGKIRSKNFNKLTNHACATQSDRRTVNLLLNSTISSGWLGHSCSFTLNERNETWLWGSALLPIVSCALCRTCVSGEAENTTKRIEKSNMEPLKTNTHLAPLTSRPTLKKRYCSTNIQQVTASISYGCQTYKRFFSNPLLYWNFRLQYFLQYLSF